MKTFEIAVSSTNILGRFESKFQTLHFSLSELNKGNFISFVIAYDDYTYVNLEKLPEAISLDEYGAIWIGKCKGQTLWINDEQVEKIATELAQVYDDIQFKDFVRAM